jgi:hypothetical protein
MQELSNFPILEGSECYLGHRKDQFKAVLILKSYSKDANVPLCWLEKGKLHSSPHL